MSRSIRPLLLLALLSACADPAALSGRYQGEIVGAEFLRRGFAEGVSLEIDLSLTGARAATGSLTTSDGLFAQSPLGPLGLAPIDLLGEARLPGGPPILLFLSAPTTQGEEALVVVSLGAGADEVRIAYGREGAPDSFYGVFPVSRASE